MTAIPEKAEQIRLMHAGLIHRVVIACQNRQLVPDLDAVLKSALDNDWIQLVTAIRRILDGAWGVIADHCAVIDTLALARQLHPGQKNNLDALCKRYGIDNSQRQLHGALLDAEILADVYLAMTGGQATLSLDSAGSALRREQTAPQHLNADRPRLAVIRATEAELAAHAARLAGIDKACGGKCVWHALEPDAARAV